MPLVTQIAPERAASVWRWCGLICCWSFCESHSEYSEISTKSVNGVHVFDSTQRIGRPLCVTKGCSVCDYPADHPGNERDDNRHPELGNQLVLSKISCFDSSQIFIVNSIAHIWEFSPNLTIFYFRDPWPSSHVCRQHLCCGYQYTLSNESVLGRWNKVVNCMLFRSESLDWHFRPLVCI